MRGVFEITQLMKRIELSLKIGPHLFQVNGYPGYLYFGNNKLTDVKFVACIPVYVARLSNFGVHKLLTQ